MPNKGKGCALQNRAFQSRVNQGDMQHYVKLREYVPKKNKARKIKHTYPHIHTHKQITKHGKNRILEIQMLPKISI